MQTGIGCMFMQTVAWILDLWWLEGTGGFMQTMISTIYISNTNDDGRYITLFVIFSVLCKFTIDWRVDVQNKIKSEDRHCSFSHQIKIYT